MISSTAIPEIQKNQKKWPLFFCFFFWGIFLNFGHPQKENWWEESFFFEFFEFVEFFEFSGRSKFKKFKKFKKKWPGFFCFFFWGIFLNFGHPQKENWWEESFFFLNFLNLLNFLNFRDGPNSKNSKKNWPGFFFAFFEFWLSSKRKLVGRVLFFLNFLNLLNFLNFRDGPNSKNSKKIGQFFFLNFLIFLNFGNPQKENWWEESFFFF